MPIVGTDMQWGASDTMLIPSAAVGWPTGDGASSGTAANSVFVTPGGGANYGILDSVEVYVTDASARTITIFKHDGTTAVRTIIIPASQPCPFIIPMGGPGGLGVRTGLSAQTSNAAITAFMCYRKA